VEQSKCAGPAAGGARSKASRTVVPSHADQRTDPSEFAFTRGRRPRGPAGSPHAARVGGSRGGAVTRSAPVSANIRVATDTAEAAPGGNVRQGQGAPKGRHRAQPSTPIRRPRPPHTVAGHCRETGTPNDFSTQPPPPNGRHARLYTTTAAAWQSLPTNAAVIETGKRGSRGPGPRRRPYADPKGMPATGNG